MSNYIFYFSRSGNSLRASIALELSGVLAESCFIDLKKKEHKAPEFMQVNPARTVPVLVKTGQGGQPSMKLTQSGAIMDFLLEKYRPDLIPEALEAKAEARALVYSAVSDIAVQNALSFYMGEYGGERRENTAFLNSRLLDSVRASFQPVEEQKYLGGARPNIADYAHLPVIYMRETFLTKSRDTKPIISWMYRMLEEPAVTRALEYAGYQRED
ncbi:glutathione S-transferase family protein [Flexibacterium corallicola]|uniref:glutathione S-transferase family protein n=1 Tax=Flexibacterium corallicola TaxID=3037259 RepID=UPI00286EE904|nr:glutathione S-transferase family protein [Pseudovibrio sp. M1P-2-3]